MASISNNGNVFIDNGRVARRNSSNDEFTTLNLQTSQNLLSGDGLSLLSANSIRKATDNSWSSVTGVSFSNIGESFSPSNPSIAKSVRIATRVVDSGLVAGCATGSLRWETSSPLNSNISYQRFTDIAYPVAVNETGDKVIVAFANQDLTEDWPYQDMNRSVPNNSSSNRIGSPQYSWSYAHATKVNGVWIPGPRVVVDQISGSATPGWVESIYTCQHVAPPWGKTRRNQFIEPSLQFNLQDLYQPKFQPFSNCSSDFSTIVHQWRRRVGNDFVHYETFLRLVNDSQSPTGSRLELIKNTVLADTTGTLVANTNQFNPFRTYISPNGQKVARTRLNNATTAATDALTISQLNTNGEESSIVTFSNSDLSVTFLTGSTVGFTDGSVSGTSFVSSPSIIHPLFLDEDTLALRCGNHLNVRRLSGNSLVRFRLIPSLSNIRAISPNGIVANRVITVNNGQSQVRVDVFDMNLNA